MRISEIGEFGLIQRIASKFRETLPPGMEGIGDDCAILPAGESDVQLVTTDMLVENVDFIRSETASADIGYKALAVNLSDIAAMGGVPKTAFLSLALPEEIEVEWCDGFLSGFHELAQESQVLLLGGDTGKSPGPVVICVTVLGEAPRDRIKLRSGAKPGDVVCVTGRLGDSGGGLNAILEKLDRNPDVRQLVERHARPRPHLREGQWLASRREVTAMMDTSDGLDSDLRRIAESSGCGADVFLERLPVSESLRNASRQFGWDYEEMAATDGEDYCLLVTIESSAFQRLSAEFRKEFPEGLFPVGEITDQSGALRYFRSGKPIELRKRGFEHFSGPGKSVEPDA